MQQSVWQIDKDENGNIRKEELFGVMVSKRDFVRSLNRFFLFLYSFRRLRLAVGGGGAGESFSLFGLGFPSLLMLTTFFSSLNPFAMLFSCVGL